MTISFWHDHFPAATVLKHQEWFALRELEKPHLINRVRQRAKPSHYPCINFGTNTGHIFIGVVSKDVFTKQEAPLKFSGFGHLQRLLYHGQFILHAVFEIPFPLQLFERYVRFTEQQLCVHLTIALLAFKLGGPQVQKPPEMTPAQKSKLAQDCNSDQKQRPAHVCRPAQDYMHPFL